jgi:HAE1 family hydrophobic/amphiphilic exporter-1
MGLTKLAISRPVTMLMLMILATVLGITSYQGMRKEENPEVSFGVITVSAVYPGAGPDEVNTLVSRKIEEALSGIEGLREVTSTSQEGLSTVVAQFEVGTNMDEALNDARGKVDQIVAQLPQQVEKPTLSKFDSGSSPVLRLVLKSDTLTNQQLRDLADDKLKDRFARIKGVATADVSGGDVREIQVQVKKDRLLAYGIGINDVLNAVRASTLNVPSGRIVSGSQEYAVRVLGEFKTVAEIQNMVLSVEDRNSQGSKPVVVRLGDIADIEDSVTERRAYARLDGVDAVQMEIQKSRAGNAIEINHGADEVIKQIKSEYNIDTVKTFNQATTIEESLNDLSFALFFGIILVTAIVFMFLHNLRGTIIVAIAIPFCLCVTILVLRMLGFTINNMSMLALSLAIGVLVDDAIVVLENIFRHLRMGENPVEASINGRSEIGLAAIAITLADVVVFIPIAFMGGVVGQFFKPLGIGYAVCTLVSLFVSFTITPMLASRWYRPGENVEHFTKGFPLWFETQFHKFENLYRRTLEWALNHRWFVFISGFVALIGIFMMIGGSFAATLPAAIMSTMGMIIISTIIGFVVFVVNIFRGSVRPQRILAGLGFGLVFPLFAAVGFIFAQWKGEPIFKFAFFPPSDAGSVSVSITLPPGRNLSETQKVVEQVEQIVMKHPDVKYTVSAVGSKGGGGFAGTVADSGTNYGEISATLNERIAIMDRLMFWVKHEEELRSRTDTAVAADILERLGKIPGAELVVSTSSGVGFGAPIQMSFSSEDRELLLETVLKIRKGLDEGAVKGVITPDISSRPGKPEIRAIPDRVRLADLGLSPADVANTMRLLYEGDDTTKFRVQGKEYDIRVMMDLDDRNNPQIVQQVPITFVQGNPVFLSQVANLNEGVGVDKINRRARTEEIQLSANLLPGYAAGTVQQEIDQWMAREKMIPEGVRITPLGQADVQAREGQYLGMALITGFFLVYMLLASLYENLLYPAIIQIAQPQAMVGALLALILTDKTLNIVGFIGIITLVGLVGKNAILLVDYTNTLRERGRNRHEALTEAGPTRLRPIMMTTLALILGMLPVALAIGRGSEFRETIGITIIGGITLSTFLTLLVIPCSYTIFDDMSMAFARAVAFILHRPPPTDRFEGHPPQANS